MRCKLIFDYWWKAEGFVNIPEPLAGALKLSAETRIHEMMRQGYTEGELLDDVDIKVEGHPTPEGGFVCRGWWNSSRYVAATEDDIADGACSVINWAEDCNAPSLDLIHMRLKWGWGDEFAKQVMEKLGETYEIHNGLIFFRALRRQS